MQIGYADFQRILSYIEEDEYDVFLLVTQAYLTHRDTWHNSKTGPLWEPSDSSERKIGSDHQMFGHWRNNAERARQTASTPIQPSKHSREQKKC